MAMRMRKTVGAVEHVEAGQDLMRRVWADRRVTPEEAGELLGWFAVHLAIDADNDLDRAIICSIAHNGRGSPRSVRLLHEAGADEPPPLEAA